MLDSFLEVSCRRDAELQESVKLAGYMSDFPPETLYQLAQGDIKLAFGSCEEWLEKYKGTPLFHDAVQLEHAELENDVARQQADAARQSETFYKTQDQIRLQKKMLDLKLIEMSEGSPAASEGQIPVSLEPAPSPLESAEGMKAASARMRKAAFGESFGRVGGMGARRSPFRSVSTAAAPVQAGGGFNAAAGFMHNGQHIPGVPSSLLQTAGQAPQALQKGFSTPLGMMPEKIPGVPASLLPKRPMPGPAIPGRVAAGELESAAAKMRSGTLRGALTNAGQAVGGAAKSVGSTLGGFAGKAKGMLGGLRLPKFAEAEFEMNFQKTALNMQGIKNFGTSALELAKKHPERAASIGGAVIGAAGGAAAGGPDHRLSGALGGAAAGGALGHAAGGIGSRMNAGSAFGDAARNYGTGLKGNARRFMHAPDAAEEAALAAKYSSALRELVG